MSITSTVAPAMSPQVPADPEPPAIPTPRRPRIAALDGLRLFAALAVVAYHFVNREGAWSADAKGLFPALFPVTAYGWLGVQLFFLISGFVICMSCWGKSVGDFFTSRVVRLFPAYWFAVIATTVVLLLTVGRKALPSWGDILTNFTMLQEAFGVEHVDGVYWTLFAELRFYLLFALLTWWGLTYRRVLGFCWAWVVASAVFANYDDGPLRLLVMPDYSWYFIAGIAFYLIHRFGPNLLLTGLVLVCFCASLPFVHSAWGNIHKYIGHQVPFWPVVLILAGCFAVMALVATGRLTWIQWRWLPYAGALTYPLYLLHQNIGRQIIQALESSLSPYAVLGAAIGSLLVASWLVHRLVERPVGRLLTQGMRKAAAQVRAADPAS
ncbi:acyltransferase [Streptomyces sp. NBC_00237]|uniref:acyltransferase family protein n=1 Tax=Streptomyces sp. NBC_00237 TaxID=2975687 RepID=UPI00224E5A5F|nr:acyltransferase [Streptomyces sp. NBC_00237]MCX5203540.1 acyltransferase [Streptomyces sp. NBC_00237]